MADPGYAAGVRAAIGTALAYGIEALEAADELPPPIPIDLLAQAGRAASHGVSLDTVLRRYFTGYAFLSKFVVEEVERAGPSAQGQATRYLRIQTRVLEHLTDAIANEYHRCAALQTTGSREQRSRAIDDLLAGQMVDTSHLTYDFNAWHLGVVAHGVGADASCRALAKMLDRQILLVPRDDDTVWAWLGGRGRPSHEPLDALADIVVDASLAIGDPAGGLAGWRQSHWQAKAAMLIALREPRPVTRYVDVALVASVARDDLLRTALRMIYLTPLEEDRDGGAVARQTLRAYLQTGQNASSAAALLGVDRHTVANRLRGIEDRIGRPLHTCITEIDLALRLERLDLLPDAEPAPPAFDHLPNLVGASADVAPKR